MAIKPASPENQTQYTVSVTHKPETPYMIPEGRIEHLESIANQIEKYEKWEPKWDFIKMTISGAGTVALAGITLMIQRKSITNDALLYSIDIVTVVAAIICLTFFILHRLLSKERIEQHVSEASEMRQVLQKVRESVIVIEPQNQIHKSNQKQNIKKREKRSRS